MTLTRFTGNSHMPNSRLLNSWRLLFQSTQQASKFQVSTIPPHTTLGRHSSRIPSLRAALGRHSSSMPSFHAIQYGHRISYMFPLVYEVSRYWCNITNNPSDLLRLCDTNNKPLFSQLILISISFTSFYII